MFVRGLFPFYSADTGGDGGAGSTGTEDTKTDNPEDKTDSTKKDETKKEENNIPKSRFDEVNNKLKDALDKITQFEQAQTKAQKDKEKADLDAKEKAGEFESLYTESKNKLTNVEADVTAKTERITVLEGVVQELLNTELNSINKEMHDLIPDNLTVEGKLSWLTKAKAKGMFGTQNNVETPIGGSTNPANPKQSTENMSAGDLFRMAFSKK